MPKHTFQERLIAGLKAIGWHEDHTDKSKYTAFRKPGHGNKLFVGKYGALRQGVCASHSRSVGDPSNQTGFYLRVLANGDTALNPAPTPASTGSGDGAGTGTGTLDTDAPAC